MIFLFTGTDRKKARAMMSAAAEKSAGKKGEIVRITDANSVADLSAVLEGGGMFGGKRVIVLEGIASNEEMRAILAEALPRLSKGEEDVYIYEEKPDAATRKLIEKHAEKSEKFDAPKAARENDIFVMASALRKGDKKALWVAYQHALTKKEAPEAIHGVLFWGAKQALLSSNDARSRKLVADLAELPHESRRSGVELEYALERYILSVHK